MDKNVFSRLKEERERLGISQIEVAAAASVSSKTVGRWEKSIGIPADKLADLALLGFDSQFVLTGYKSSNPPTFESKLDRLSALTARFQAIADGRKQQADPYQLGPVRDFAFQNGLTDAQIEALFDLLELSGVKGFWLEG